MPDTSGREPEDLARDLPSALAHVVLIVFITLLIVRWSIAGPIARTAHWMKALRTGRAISPRQAVPDLELFRPLAREVATFAESLNTARSAAEIEARLRETGNPSGLRTAWRCMFRRGWKTAGFLWSPTASRTCTCGAARRSK